MGDDEISLELLEAVLSPDAGRRKHGEEFLSSLPNSRRVRGLVERLSNHQDPPAVKQLSAVLLRRYILQMTDTAVLRQLVSPMLQLFASTADGSKINANVQKSLGYCLAEVCGCLAVLEPQCAIPVVSQVLASLEASISSPASLQVLATIAEKAPVPVTHLVVPSLPSLVSRICSSSVSDLTTLALTRVVVQGAVATTRNESYSIPSSTESTVQNLDSMIVSPDDKAAVLSPTVAPLWQLLLACNDETIAYECLQEWSFCATVCPSVIAVQTNMLQGVMEGCLQLANHSASSTIRIAALQVLTSILSVGDVKRRILPSQPNLMSLATQVIAPAALLVLNVCDDVEYWAEEPATLVEGDDELEEDQDAFYAETLVCELLQQLPQVCLDPLLQLIQEYMSFGGDWRRIRAGLALLEGALAVAPVQLMPHATPLVEAALKFASSSNPRVLYHALRLLGSLCEAPWPLFYETHGASVLERLANALSPSACSKVNTMASLAIVSYCRSNSDLDTEHLLVPYLGPLLTSLVQGPLATEPSLSDVGHCTSQVRAMGAVACLAQAVGDQFAPYYDRLQPGLLKLATAGPTTTTSDVSGAALQASTIIGSSVPEMFSNDAKVLMQWMLPLLSHTDNAATTRSSVPMDQLLAACARIASCIGEAYLPFLPSILPRLLHIASQAPDISVQEGTEESSRGSTHIQDGMQSMTIALVGKGLTKITLNTSLMQEQAQAARVLYEHAASLGSAFGPHVEPCMKVFLPLVEFRYSPDVRGTAAQTCAALLDSACLHSEETGQWHLAKSYIEPLVTSIARQVAQEDTTDREALYAMADALSECFYIIYRYRSEESGQILRQAFTTDLAERSVKCSMQALQACLARRREITQGFSSLQSEDEKNEYAEMLKSEEQLLTPLVDATGFSLKFLGPRFCPIFSRNVAPVLGPYLKTLQDIRASVSAVCLYDDCVEHCGSEAATKYAPHLLQGILLAFEGGVSDIDLIQAAVYGTAQIARYAPRNVLVESLPSIVHRLMQICTSGNHENNAYLVEVAVSALATLVLFGPFGDLKFVNRDAVIELFLSHLPLTQDEDEAKVST
jgi:hypothetical protein